MPDGGRGYGIATVLGRALAHGRQPDDELWFGPGPLPAPDELAARYGDAMARATDCGTGCGSFQATCPNTVVHASRQSAQAYLAGQSGLDAQILDQDAAIERGRLNFGSLLTEPV